ncbi:hypothetical protein FOZ60_016790 [Perkinsus olseni]|uniref:P-type ATPase C-terminal domain-containing protein n=1 Tax=Perkinsus olseni TaxID=32597 RepID=A0A7J6P4Q0_PEROL|nr:hypothetical protein FOZ60_016790 [Perkinsus olseni]
MSGKYAYGVVVYCGMNTRIYRNSAESGTGRNKISKLMQTYNQHVIVLFTLQAMICIVAAFAHGWIYATTTDNSKADDDDTTTTYYWYLYVGPQSVDAGDVLSRGLRVAGSLLLQFTYFVPISLLVTLEIVKYFQGRFVSADGLMQHNGLSAASNSSTLIEELGSVTHVFSDKTGTLTDNLMIFTSAYVMGSGAANSPLLERYQPTDGIPPNPERHVSGQFDARVFERVVLEDGDLHDTPLLFLLGLCLCHSVLIKDSIEASDDPLKRLGSEFLYDASSPDELALVAGARHLGFEFTARPTPDTIRINLTTPFARKVMQREDTSIDVELLEVIEFDNDRKRMSVLGEDNISIGRGQEALPSLIRSPSASSFLSSLDAASPEEELESVLDALSAGGLRTLVYGVRDLTSDMPFVESWRRSYNGARGLVGDAKERALGQCIQEMECDIDIVGCTGIEDKLQDYVPDTIADLHEAGIKVWVLTGDKIETAINIAYLEQLRDEGSLTRVGFVSQFSGTSLYDPILKQGYNVIFTLLPILLYGIFDRQLPTNITSSCPYLYLWPGISLKRLCRMECTSRKLIRLKFSPFNLFGNKHLLLWLLAAAWVSVCSTVPPMVYLYNASIDSNGNSSASLAGVGSLIFLHIIILCNFVVYMLSNIRYWFTHIGIIGGIIAYLLVWIILTVSSSYVYASTTDILPAGGLLIISGGRSDYLIHDLLSPSTGAVLLSGLGIAFLPFVLYHQYKPLFSPRQRSFGQGEAVSWKLYSAVDDHEGPQHPKDLQSSSTAHLSHHQQHHLASPPLSHPRHVTTIGAGPVPSRVLDGDIGRRRAATLASRGFGFDEVSRVDRIGKYRSVDTISLAGSSPVSRYHQRHTVDWSDGRRDDSSAPGQPLQRDRWQTRRSISGCSDGGDSSS